jgi:hypothetical protein
MYREAAQNVMVAVSVPAAFELGAPSCTLPGVLIQPFETDFKSGET